MNTGISDAIFKVEVKQAHGGDFYADCGHASTKVFPTPRQAAAEGNRMAINLYGTTCRLLDINQFRG